MTRHVLLTVLLLAASPAVWAQPPDPSANAKVRIGPLALTPTVSITNAGVDTNVFNEPSQAGPKKDFTATIEPRTDLWLHVGRSLVSGEITEDLVWFNKYADQRSVNNRYKLGVLVPLTRLNLNGGVTFLSTRERPGFEIDARARRTEVEYDGGVEFLALSKTYLGVAGRRQKTDFDKDVVFLNSNLHDELNRTLTSGAVTIRHELTSLTTLSLEAGVQHDRFPFNPLRNSDSTRVAATVKFDPFALLKGNVTFGFRDFKPADPKLAGYRGSTAAVNLTYVASGSTKLAVMVARDVQYSFDVNQPYYLQTGVTASLSQQIFGPVDVVGRFGFQRLEYRDRAGTAVLAPDRTDHIRSYGGGVGYHLGREVRLGFNVDNARRTSPVANRQYEGLRYGTAVTYEF